MKQVLNSIITVVILLNSISLFAQNTGQNSDQQRDQTQTRNTRETRERTGGERPGGFARGNMADRFLDNPMMAEKLGLTEDQKTRMRELSKNAQARNDELMEQMKAASRAQAEAMTAGEVDEAAVMSKVEEIGRIRTEMAKQQTQQLLSLQKIFTPEQRAKMKEHMNKMRDGERPGAGEQDDGEMRRNTEQRREEFQKRKEEFQKRDKNRPPKEGGAGETGTPAGETPLFEL